MVAFELSFNIRKEFFKNVCGEIAFALISLFHVQESASRSTTAREHLSFLQNLLRFIITKYLKQEVDHELSVWVDESSP